MEPLASKPTRRIKALAKAGQWAFAICLIGLAGQQLYYSDLRPVFVPAWAWSTAARAVLAYLFSAILIGTAATLLLGKGVRPAMLLLGSLLLALFIFSYVPYELLVDPNRRQIGAWNNALKELNISGGAFLIAGIAGAYPQVLIRMGRIFYAIMLVIFGFEHFLYAEGVRKLVPTWIPGDLFWTYFAAVALIGSGISLLFRIKVKAISLLLGIMVFIWFLVLHIPRALVAPATDMGNELSSVFESLGVSGIAFVIWGYATSRISPRQY